MTDGSTTRRTVLIGTGLAAAAHAHLASAQAPPVPGVVPGGGAGPANAGTVGVITGGVEGTYIRIAADLASVLDDGDRLRVLPVMGKGSLQNIADIIYLRGIDVGIVQSDVLAYVLRENRFPGIARAVSYIAKLYDEEIHVLARPEVKAIGDLAGKRVNIDVKGSGTAMTASLLFGTLQVAIQPVHDTQNNALRQLQDGEIAALVYVAGRPASLFTAIPPDSGLHFLPIPPAAALIETYLPAQLSSAAYPSLIRPDAPVETIAVGAVMASFNWQPGTERYTKVARFIAALSGQFAQFQRAPRHPKWREVNLAAEVPGWTRFALGAESKTDPRGALRRGL